MGETLRLTAEELSAEAFAPFGRVIEPPRRPSDAHGPGWQWWGETLLLSGDGRPFGVGLLELTPAALSFDWAERHLRSVEAVVAVDADCLVYVGLPGELEPVRMDALQGFRVFRIAPGRGVVLDRGVWHGAPLVAEGPARAVVLLLEGTGSRDTEVVRFTDTPVEVQP
jgi:ureidoglycolate lyase